MMMRIQKRNITGYAYKMAKSMMPKISGKLFAIVCIISIVFNFIETLSAATERAALNAGTVGFDRNIFSGNPSLEDLKGYTIKASAEEQGIAIFSFMLILFDSFMLTVGSCW
jgi:hypothetical protein